MRKFGLLLFLLVFGGNSMAWATPYSSTVLSDSPVAYWRMGETSGPIVDEVSGRTGTLSGGNTTGVPGAIVGDPDTAISSGSGGGTISVPFDAAMNTSAFSIELWVKFGSICSDGTGSGNHCNIAGPPASASHGYAFGPADTQPAMTHSFVVDHPGESNGIFGPTVALNEWYHLVGSFDGSTQRFFVNGILAGAQTADFAPETSAPFELFGSSNKGMENGAIDEVAYYNYALGADRVSNHYLTGIGIIPEPSTGLLLATGLLGLAIRRRTH